jgi:thioredoxin 1
MSMQTEYTPQEPSRAEIDALPGPTLIEFGAPWCPHCQALQPQLGDLLAKFPEVRHIKIEDGKGKPLGRSFQVRLWPNLVFLRDGRVVQQSARPQGPEVLCGLTAIANLG